MSLGGAYPWTCTSVLTDTVSSACIGSCLYTRAGLRSVHLRPLVLTIHSVYLSEHAWQL
eukprot:SAG31_NODE_3552_length_4131_cov_2.172123_2_plen_59_part_00